MLTFDMDQTQPDTAARRRNAVIALVLLISPTSAVAAPLNKEEIPATFVTGTVIDDSAMEDDMTSFSSIASGTRIAHAANFATPGVGTSMSLSSPGEHGLDLNTSSANYTLTTKCASFKQA